MSPLSALVVLAPSLLGTAPAASAPVHPGIDVADMDRAVAPGEDFFTFANGTWENATRIPSDLRAWGAFNALAEQAEERLHGLLEKARASPPGVESITRRAGDFYASFLDEGAIESLGLEPLQVTLKRIAAVTDKDALAAELGRELRADVDPLNNTHFHTSHLFGLWVGPNMKAPARNAAYLLQGGLALPDRSYYLDPGATSDATRAAYRTYVQRLLTLAEYPDVAGAVERIVRLETQIAQAHWSRQKSGDEMPANQRWKARAFSTQAPGLNWNAFFAAADLKTVDAFFVWQPSAFKGISALVASEPLQSWKDLLVFHVLDENAAFLPKAYSEAAFELHAKTLEGTPTQSHRWKRAVRAANAFLPDDVGQLSVRRYFPPEAKAAVQKMVENVRAAFRARIDQLSWMSEKTKARAREKLAAIRVGVGYPAVWENYEGLRITRNELLGNVERVRLYVDARERRKIGALVNRDEWIMPAQTVNAVNLPLHNALNIPAAILEPPFFDLQGTAAANYGAIGLTLGHEISHSFDSSGALFDAGGRYANWWTPSDFAHFEQAGKKLVAQYDAYHPFADLAINGQQTLSENVADLAGLNAAYDAYLLATRGQPQPVIDGFTGPQQFFISYAQMNRFIARESYARGSIVMDGHAPPRYRALTVRNLAAWYEAFRVSPQQRLYLPPEKRVEIW